MTNAPSKKILFLSVGGSEQPLRSSLLESRPDQVVFVVSDGSGGSRSSREQAIKLFEADGCPERREVLEVPPENLDSALGKIEPRLNKCLQNESEVTVDYTGGTKSMTSALVLAATCYAGVRLQFMVGARNDLESVQDGTEKSLEIPKDLIGLSQTFGTVRAFIERRNYGAALSILFETDKIFEKLSGKSTENMAQKNDAMAEMGFDSRSVGPLQSRGGLGKIAGRTRARRAAFKMA